MEKLSKLEEENKELRLNGGIMAPSLEPDSPSFSKAPAFKSMKTAMFGAGGEIQESHENLFENNKNMT